MNRSTRAAGVALACLIAVAGCSSGGQRTEPDLDVPADISLVVYPLDGYRLTPQQQALSRKAFHRVAERCTARFGLTLPPIGANEGRPPAGGRYGLTDENTARTKGYSLDQPVDSGTSWVERITPDSELFGVFNGRRTDGTPVAVPGLPDGGCQGEAERALTEGGPARPARDLVTDLERQAVRRARDDSRVRATTDAWKKCVRQAGYPYSDPLEAPYSYWSGKRIQANPHPTQEQKEHGIPPTQEEITAGLADVRCKHESGLLATWVAADIAYQHVLIDENTESLRTFRESVEQEMRNARALT